MEAPDKNGSSPKKKSSESPPKTDKQAEDIEDVDDNDNVNDNEDDDDETISKDDMVMWEVRKVKNNRYCKIMIRSYLRLIWINIGHYFK